MIKRIWVRIRRMHYSKGFGVQSPFAYSFITEVINQTSLYYSYFELDRLYGENSSVRSKLARLYFRLTNYCQPSVVVEYCTSTDSLCKAFHAAHSGIDFKWLDSSLVDGSSMYNLENVDLFRIVLDQSFREVFGQSLLKITPNSVLLLEGINKNSETKKFWHEVVADNNAVVTFDLYDVGIVFFNKNYYKQNYVVNF